MIKLYFVDVFNKYVVFVCCKVVVVFLCFNVVLEVYILSSIFMFKDIGLDIGCVSVR